MHCVHEHICVLHTKGKCNMTDLLVNFIGANIYLYNFYNLEMMIRL